MLLVCLLEGVPRFVCSLRAMLIEVDGSKLFTFFISPILL